MINESGKSVSETELQRQIIEAGACLAEWGLIVAAEGNISARVNADRILITPGGAWKDRLTMADLITVGALGKPLTPTEGHPSSEIGMHLCVYQRRPDIMACVHAHPPYAVACSVAGISLAEPVLPEIVAVVGTIAIAEYATPSTPEIAASIVPLVDDHDAIILSNHGVLCIGETLKSALGRMALVEHLAQVVFLASQLGSIRHLTPAQVASVRRIAGRPPSRPTKEKS